MSATTETITTTEAEKREREARDAGFEEGLEEGGRRAYDDGYRAAREEFDHPDSWAVVMERWHNEHHAGVFRLCYESPCRSLRGDTHA